MNRIVRFESWRIGTAALLAIVLFSPTLAAQDEANRFDAQQFNPMPSQLTNYFSVSSSRVLESGQWELGILGHYADDPLVLRTTDGTRIESIIGSQMVANIMGGIGIEEIFEITFDVPLVLAQTGDEITRLAGANASEASFSPGDIRLIPKLQLFNTDTDEHPGGAAMAFLLNTFIPTGNADNFQGEGFRMEPRLAMDLILRSGTRFSLNVGYLLREAAELENIQMDDTFTYGFGADFVTSPYFHITTEVSGEAALMADDLDAAMLPLEALLGFKIFPIETFVISLGGGGGIVEGFGIPDFRVFLGLSGSVIPDRDPDHDGIFGEEDQCPLNPEDFDDFEDINGCPDPDNDQDEVLDVYDGCPLDPEDRDNFEDEDGCPDPDNDQDGILDGDDSCPIDPEDIDGFEDIDGCPDPDNDQDNILDGDDECRNDPEDFDGFEDEDGCPDPDNDLDGILDTVDDCPNEPEVWNAFEDDDGCPDESIIEVTCDAINIYEKVYFESDSDVIMSRSYDLLTQVAQVLAVRPDILRIRIEGHTDDRGSDSHNLDLSDRRASSVRLYLIERGIAPTRLESAGYGETLPIADNDTRDGRAENRRVQFVILEQEGCEEEAVGQPPTTPPTN